MAAGSERLPPGRVSGKMSPKGPADSGWCGHCPASCPALLLTGDGRWKCD